MDDKEYEQFVAALVRGLSIARSAQVYTNRRYPGSRQPGSYEVDVACEVWIDAALFFLIIVECKNWKRPVDRPQIQKLIQTRDAISAHKAVVASPVGFTDEAVAVAEAHGIALWVVAEGIYSVAAGGGMSALSFASSASHYLRNVVYNVIGYDHLQYIRELGHYRSPRGRHVVPFSWSQKVDENWPGWPFRFEACRPFASAYNPVVGELIVHIFNSECGANKLTRIIHDAVETIRSLLEAAGMTDSQAQNFLDSFAIPMITEGMSLPQFFETLNAFDAQLPHQDVQLLPPVSWIEKFGQQYFIYPNNENPAFHLERNIIWLNAGYLLSNLDQS
jgi:hypothetical protein